MGAKTKIQWANHSWSPWRSCQHAILPDGSEHPGCLHCYAEAMAKRNPGVLGVWGPEGTRVLAAPKSWEQVRRWNAEAEKVGKRQSVFPSVCDPFESWDGPLLFPGKQPVYVGKSYRASSGPENRITLAEVRQDFFAMIDTTPWLNWLLLTKRPQDIRRLWWGIDGGSEPPGNYLDNVALITSVSTQHDANLLIPELLKCRDLCPVLGVSYEPALGPVDFMPWLGESHWWCAKCYSEKSPVQVTYEELCTRCGGSVEWRGGIDWLIAGGESGHHARPFDIAWARSTRDQCRAAGVPFFLKQLGPQPYTELRDENNPSYRGALSKKMKDSHGGDESEWPEDLRGCREFPSMEAAHDV